MPAWYGRPVHVYRESCILSRNESCEWMLPGLPTANVKVRFTDYMKFSWYPTLIYSRLDLQSRAKHILQCQRKSLNAAPYQQNYKNGKRAHRRVNRAFVQFCYLCAEFSYSEEDWDKHCQFHLANLQPRCGILTFRYTLVAAGLCPFCLGDETKNPSERFNQWLQKSTLLNHIDDKHMNKLCQPETRVQCPHPCCRDKHYGSKTGLRRHFFDVHSLSEPRSNCVSRKRRWDFQDDVNPTKVAKHEKDKGSDNFE